MGSPEWSRSRRKGRAVGAAGWSHKDCSSEGAQSQESMCAQSRGRGREVPERMGWRMKAKKVFVERRNFTSLNFQPCELGQRKGVNVCIEAFLSPVKNEASMSTTVAMTQPRPGLSGCKVCAISSPSWTR